MTMLLKNANTKDRVLKALAETGYTFTTDEIRSALFDHMAFEKEVHRITFIDDNTGKLDRGYVYVWTEGGRTMAEF